MTTIDTQTPDIIGPVTALDQLPETLTVEQFSEWQQMHRDSVYGLLSEFGEKGPFHYRIGRRQNPKGKDRRPIRIMRDKFIKWRASQMIP